MSKFTTTFCNNKVVAAGFSSFDRNDLKMTEQRFMAKSEAETTSRMFWEVETQNTVISKSDAAMSLHHLVHAASRYQTAHKAELLRLNNFSKNSGKVLLFLGDKEKLLHDDISNLLGAKVERDHRTFVGNEIAKLELFLSPSSNGISRNSKKTVDRKI